MKIIKSPAHLIHNTKIDSQMNPYYKLLNLHIDLNNTAKNWKFASLNRTTVFNTKTDV